MGLNWHMQSTWQSKVKVGGIKKHIVNCLQRVSDNYEKNKLHNRNHWAPLLSVIKSIQVSLTRESVSIYQEVDIARKQDDDT